ncbi:MAG: hypothetical protein JWN74_2693 [Acidobacteriaceae bacterium]|nr:hypothetical protein [Acidobacteriaceae bacterium]
MPSSFPSCTFVSFVVNALDLPWPSDGFNKSLFFTYDDQFTITELCKGKSFVEGDS